MTINWTKIWERFDQWWDKHEENFEDKNHQRWPYQAKAIKVLINDEFKRNVLPEESWSKIWSTLDTWWSQQKTAHMPWETQQRKIQQVISLEITNVS